MSCQRTKCLGSAGLALGLVLAWPAAPSALLRTTLISQYAANRWGMSEGLPQASVNAIAQPADGYIWLATEEGLVRFDGVRFTVFDATNSALTETFITNLHAGRDGSLWIRTSEALYRYAGGVIRRVCALQSIGLSSSPMLEDRSGSIWSRAVGGVTEYTSTGVCRHHAFEAGSSDAAALALTETSDSTILIGTSRGLKQFRDGAIAAASYPDIPTTPITALHVDREGSLWAGGIGTLLRQSRGGLKRFGTPDGVPDAEVNTILQDKDGSIWFGSNTGGIGRILGDRVETFTTANGLPENRVRAMYEDQEGGIWIGMAASGALRLRDASATTFGRHQGVPADVVRALLQDRTGRFFVGLEGSGLVVRSADGTFTADPTLDRLRSNSIRALHEDGEQGVLIGTDEGLFRLRDGVLTKEPEQSCFLP